MESRSRSTSTTRPRWNWIWKNWKRRRSTAWNCEPTTKSATVCPPKSSSAPPKVSRSIPFPFITTKKKRQFYISLLVMTWLVMNPTPSWIKRRMKGRNWRRAAAVDCYVGGASSRRFSLSLCLIIGTELGFSNVNSSVIQSLAKNTGHLHISFMTRWFLSTHFRVSVTEQTKQNQTFQNCSILMLWKLCTYDAAILLSVLSVISKKIIIIMSS